MFVVTFFVVLVGSEAISQEALINKNCSICEETYEPFKSECKSLCNARINHNKTYCEEFFKGSDDNIKYCYSYVLEDKSYCEQIKSTSLKKECNDFYETLKFE